MSAGRARTCRPPRAPHRVSRLQRSGLPREGDADGFDDVTQDRPAFRSLASRTADLGARPAVPGSGPVERGSLPGARCKVSGGAFRRVLGVPRDADPISPAHRSGRAADLAIRTIGSLPANWSGAGKKRSESCGRPKNDKERYEREMQHRSKIVPISISRDYRAAFESLGKSLPDLWRKPGVLIHQQRIASSGRSSRGTAAPPARRCTIAS